MQASNSMYSNSIILVNCLRGNWDYFWFITGVLNLRNSFIDSMQIIILRNITYLIWGNQEWGQTKSIYCIFSCRSIWGFVFNDFGFWFELLIWNQKGSIYSFTIIIENGILFIIRVFRIWIMDMDNGHWTSELYNKRFLYN